MRFLSPCSVLSLILVNGKPACVLPAFCVKAGCGIGAAIPGAILAYFGYVANAEQSAESLAGISFAFIWLPVILFVIALIPLLFYRKYESMEDKIRKELDERNAAIAAE